MLRRNPKPTTLIQKNLKRVRNGRKFSYDKKIDQFPESRMTYKSHFKQGDVKRALKGVKQAGLVPASCKIDENGTITVAFLGEKGRLPANENPWDEELDNGPASFPS